MLHMLYLARQSIPGLALLVLVGVVATYFA